MPLNSRTKNRGDTLIEVLFAMAVFSLVAVGSLSVMNQGTATAQRALEITLVRNEIDAQAEALRFMNTSYISAYNSGTNYTGAAKEWSDMSVEIKTDTIIQDFGISANKCPMIPNGSFIVNARKATYIKPTGSGAPGPSKIFSQVNYDNNDDYLSAEGIWIQAIKVAPSGNNQDNAGYIDFNIRACWDSPGQSVPVTLGTIVRLYEPRG